MRKLKRFDTNVAINLANTSDKAKGIKKTSVEDIYNNFYPSDLMLSILVDKRFNSTEKAILGLFIEESLSFKDFHDMGDGNQVEVDYFPSSVTVDIDSCIVIAEYLTTKEISNRLNISMPTVFNNISTLREKGIISFERYKFGEYAKIGFNIGYLSLCYFK